MDTSRLLTWTGRQEGRGRRGGGVVCAWFVARKGRESRRIKGDGLALGVGDVCTHRYVCMYVRGRGEGKGMMAA